MVLLDQTIQTFSAVTKVRQLDGGCDREWIKWRLTEEQVDENLGAGVEGDASVYAK